MSRKHLIAAFAAVAFGLWASVASAQTPPPTLELDFVGGTVPLSPALVGLIAVVLAVTGIYMLRRSRGRGRLVSVVVLGLAALGFSGALTRAPLIANAQAALPDRTLPLSVSPAGFSEFFVGFVHALNVTGQPLTITAIKFDPHGANYFISTPESNCAVGMVLAPNQSCVITIRTTG